jgi:hypothetical protein
MMPRRRDWAKSVIESNNDFSRVKSWVFELWSVAGLDAPLLARDLSIDGQTVEKAAVRWSRVLVSVVPAWPIGKAINSALPQYFLRAAMRGGVLLGLLVELTVAAEVPAKADLDEDEGVLLFVEGGRVGRGSIWDPSCVDEVRCYVMSGIEHQLGLSMWENPIRDAAWRCGAFFVSGSGGETPMVVFGVYGDIGVSSAANLFRRE